MSRPITKNAPTNLPDTNFAIGVPFANSELVLSVGAARPAIENPGNYCCKISGSSPLASVREDSKRCRCCFFAQKFTEISPSYHSLILPNHHCPPILWLLLFVLIGYWHRGNIFFGADRDVLPWMGLVIANSVLPQTPSSSVFFGQGSTAESCRIA